MVNSFHGEPGESQLTESTDDADARRDFWSTQSDFIYRHHIEPRVQLHVPKEETFPIPLTYIDLNRATYTNPHVLQEKLEMTIGTFHFITPLMRSTLLRDKVIKFSKAKVHV